MQRGDLQDAKLRKLSEKEKFQLLELQKTRDRITEELRRYPNVPSGFESKHGRRSISVTNTQKTKQPLSKTASFIEGLKIKSGLDMVPLMSSTGELAFEVGLNNSGKIKLPIFRLPAIERASISAQTFRLNDKKETSDNVVQYKIEFIPYNSRGTLKSALLVMMRSMSIRSKEFTKKYLSISEADVSDFESIMEVLDPVRKTSMNRDDQSSFKLSIKDLFLFDEDLSVFVKMGDLIHQTKLGAHVDEISNGITSLYSFTEFQQRSLSLSPRNDLNSFSRETLKRTQTFQLSSLSTLGFSSELAEFVADHQHLDTLPRPSSYSIRNVDHSASHSKQKQQQQSLRHGGSRAGRETTKKIRLSSSSHSASLDLGVNGSGGGGPPHTLTTELAASLQRMQDHTKHVKKGIAHVQQLLSISTNSGDKQAESRARTLLYTVAAERMSAALRAITHTDLRRALAAWAVACFQERCIEKAKRISRLLVVRNTILGVNNLLRKKISRFLLNWISFTLTERARYLHQKQLEAVVNIQRVLRGKIHRKKVAIKRQRRKYEKLYDSTIKIQALMRGAYARWKLKERLKREKQNSAAVFIQRCFRGYRGRKRVYKLLLHRNKGFAATMIQKIVRGISGRKRIIGIRLSRRRTKAAILVQTVIRGFVTRRTVARKLANRAKEKFVVRIQALMRGYIARKNIHRKIAAIENYKQARMLGVVKIQAAYRGYRGRKLSRMMMFKLRKKRDSQYKAATKINSMVRGFICRCYLRDLKKEQMEKWLTQARSWQEMWSDDSNQWFYLNAATGDAVWEPTKEGYTKFDGRLVLANGAIVDDPRNTISAAGEASVTADGDDTGKKKGGHKICSECSERVAIRACNECGDRFCTKCYKATHATGSRRRHTYVSLGPLDCSECELVLSERWCVSCDEAFCDSCWRKVHSHGKRRFHAYSEVSSEGRIDSHIFTMDGEEFQQYDSTIAQQKADQLSASTYGAEAAAGTAYGYGAGSGEWSEFSDENGYPYWYNSVTGVSQYENPFG